MPLRVLVLEDDPLIRLSVVSALRHFTFKVVAEESEPTRTIHRAAVVRPEVAVLDLHLGKGATGLDVARELRRLNPRIGIVFLTSFEDPRLLGPSLPPAPRGSIYVTKRSIQNLTVLKEAVEKASENPGDNFQGDYVSAFGHLSDLQVETLRLVAEGLSNAEIAKRRFIKEKSVELTISRVAKALGLARSNAVNQRVHIARVYFRATGLVQDAPDV